LASLALVAVITHDPGATIVVTPVAATTVQIPVLPEAYVVAPAPEPPVELTVKVPAP
jgi:hypothetical protein